MIQKLLHTNSALCKSLSVAFFFLFSGYASSFSFAQAVVGAREMAMGQAVTALASQWSVFGNPAMMDREKGTVSFFGVRYYGFSEITDMAVSITYPVRAGTFGGGAYRYGDELFSENRLRLGYKNAFQGFHYGLVINYNHIVQGGGYGSLTALGIDVGLAARIAEGFLVGAKATNINQPSYGSYNTISEEPPRELSIGLTYRLSELALFSSDIVKDVRFPLSYRGGVEVKVFGNLKGRIGVTAGPLTYAAGFGYRAENWEVNVAVQQHENPVLGLSPGFDLSILW